MCPYFFALYFFGKESESSRKNNKPAVYAERQQQEIYIGKVEEKENRRQADVIKLSKNAINGPSVRN